MASKEDSELNAAKGDRQTDRQTETETETERQRTKEANPKQKL